MHSSVKRVSQDHILTADSAICMHENNFLQVLNSACQGKIHIYMYMSLFQHKTFTIKDMKRCAS